MVSPCLTHNLSRIFNTIKNYQQEIDSLTSDICLKGKDICRIYAELRTKDDINKLKDWEVVQELEKELIRDVKCYLEKIETYHGKFQEWGVCTLCISYGGIVPEDQSYEFP